MLRDPIIAAIRTGAAALVTLILGWLATTLGVPIPDDLAPQLAGVLFAAAVALVNLAVGWLSGHVHPLFGYLLGVPRSPSYRPQHSDDGAVSVRFIGATALALALVAVYALPALLTA